MSKVQTALWSVLVLSISVTLILLHVSEMYVYPTGKVDPLLVENQNLRAENARLNNYMNKIKLQLKTNQVEFNSLLTYNKTNDDFQSNASLIYYKIIKPIHEKWNNILKSNGLDKGEGHSGKFIPETLFYIELIHNYIKSKNASKHNKVLVCEIGFNLGHSALTFLYSDYLYRVKYVGFSMNVVSQELISILLKDLYRPTKDSSIIQIIWGDSTETVPEYIKYKQNTDQVHDCDILVIDGGHLLQVATADILNMKHLANVNDHLLILDDCRCRSFCIEPTMAWDDAINKSVIYQIGYQGDGKNTRGWCWGKYIF